MNTPTSETSALEPPDSRGVAILARTLFRQMRDQGYSTDQIIGLSSELLQMVSTDLQRDLAAAE